MDADRFRSKLGDVAVAKDHVERERSDAEEWEIIERNFSEKRLADHVKFSKIEGIEYEDNSIFPNIVLETRDGQKRLFFLVGDRGRECFKRLRYRLNAFRESY
ncbi:MAG: hypothetical protein ABEJ75_03945 [Candidatus Nanohaloarchaea archaeon]